MTADQVIELVSVLVWPLTILLAIIALRRSLGAFLEGVAGRVTRVAVFQVAVDLAEVPQFTPSWSGPHWPDIRKLNDAGDLDSGSEQLFAQLRDMHASDYAVIDLGCGEEWLTSRLYIFAVMLQRMRGLRCLAFIDSTQEGHSRFVGLATPSAVRWSLAQRFPWLEAAYISASQLQFGAPIDQKPFIYSSTGALDPEKARRLAHDFLRGIQVRAPSPPVSAAPGYSMHDWESLPGSVPLLWEHASWLTAVSLRRILREQLRNDSVQVGPDLAPSERTKAILRRRSEFVARLDEDGAFIDLIDREILLEEVIERRLWDGETSL